MVNSIEFDFMLRGEEKKICDLVRRTFDICISPLYSKKGIREFKAYIRPRLLAKRSRSNHFVLVARQQDILVGMIEVREYHHITLFFVEKGFQGKGIGKALLQKALAYCQIHIPDLKRISVNSSPNAIPVYSRLGFRKAAAEQLENGLRFVPMVLSLV